MNTVERRSFPLGRVVATPNALETIPSDEVMKALGRHAACDWGDVGPADCKENELSLREGFRLLSVYHTAGGVKFWVITEADRSVTTVLLPEDY
jgi:hypothetical protein